MYKAFNNDLINRYNEKYELDKVYSVEDDVKFGTNGNGFHMCKNMEDTFRYYDFKNDSSILTLVEGIGEFTEYADEYYGYYEMYAYQAMKILKILSREEILEYFVSLGSNMQIERFIQGYKFTKEELFMIKKYLLKFLEYSYMQNYIENYQGVTYEQIKKM